MSILIAILLVMVLSGVHIAIALGMSSLIGIYMVKIGRAHV